MLGLAEEALGLLDKVEGVADLDAGLSAPRFEKGLRIGRFAPDIARCHSEISRARSATSLRATRGLILAARCSM